MVAFASWKLFATFMQMMKKSLVYFSGFCPLTMHHLSRLMEREYPGNNRNIFKSEGSMG